MSLQKFHSFVAIAGTALLGVTLSMSLGCGGATDGDHDTDGHHEEDGHDHGGHAEKGPNGGHLIELGRDHTYHAELVEDDDAKSFSVFILGSDTSKVLPIAAESLSISLDVDGDVKNFELVSFEPADGKTSQFKAEGSELFELFEKHHDDLKGKLRVTIDGTPISGEIAHQEHGHEGHDHD